MHIKNIELLKYTFSAGLSQKAGLVYVSLIEASVAIAPIKIIKLTGLHRKYVYDGIHELSAKGLLATIGVGRKIKYLPQNPERLMFSIEEQRLKTQESVNGLLEAFNKHPQGAIEIIEGVMPRIASEIRLLEEQKENSTLHIIGGGGSKFMGIFEKYYDEYERLRIKKNIYIKFIGDRRDSYNTSSQTITRSLYESRLIEGLDDSITISIRPDSVAFNIYRPEISSVRVKSKEAAASLQKLFDAMWKVLPPTLQ